MPSAPDGADAAGDLAAEIAAHGPLRFDRFMDLALYGEHGFYTGHGRAGRRGGDFITSPEVGPLFGAVLVRALDAWWDELGGPDPFVVVDVGAGPGTLARSILAARGRCSDALAVVAVEVSASQRASHPSGPGTAASFTSSPTMPEGPVHVVLANELLDNLPVRLLVFDGGWREAHVAMDGDRVVEVLRPISHPSPDRVLAQLPARPSHGARAPLQDAAAAWVAAAAAVSRRVVAIDYATASTADLAARPWRTWLRTYREHRRGAHYLADPGRQDITTEVALDQLPVPGSVSTQAQFLRRWGIDALVEEGRTAWRSAAATPDLRALAMRSRIREAESLLDPDGLGGFSVIEWPGR